MKLRDALAQSPTKAAGNNNLAWGHGSIVSCTQRKDGKIEVKIYMRGGEYQTGTFDTPEEVSTALYSQGTPRKQDFAVWDGPDTWYPLPRA